MRSRAGSAGSAGRRGDIARRRAGVSRAARRVVPVGGRAILRRERDGLFEGVGVSHRDPGRVTPRGRGRRDAERQERRATQARRGSVGATSLVERAGENARRNGLGQSAGFRVMDLFKISPEFMSELGGESAFPWQSSQRAAAVLAAEEGGGWSGASVGGAAGVYCGPGAWVCVPGGAILGGLVGAIGGGELSGWIHDLSTRLSDSEIEALQLRAQESVARASAAETIKEADSGM